MYRTHLRTLSCARFSIASRGKHCTTCEAVVRDIQADVTAGKRSAVEVAQQYLKQIKEREERLGSFITIDEEGALAQAAAIDEKIAAGEKVGALAGVPVAVKDNICTAGLETTAASRSLKGYVPPFDATAVARLRAAGAVIVGKTNMDEFGMGSTTENSAYQRTKNAWSEEHVPGVQTLSHKPYSAWHSLCQTVQADLFGVDDPRCQILPLVSSQTVPLRGSSGGSGAAVAGGQVPVALGSDTGGSVRQPASFNGCVGVKPSYGRVSRHGLIAYASSLDCIGTLTQSAYDAALVLSVISGADALDSTSLTAPVADLTAGLLNLDQMASRPLDGLRVGIIEDTIGDGVEAPVQKAVLGGAQHLESLGATVGRVSMKSFSSGLPAYYIIASSEASSNLSRYDGVRYGQRQDASELKGMYKGTRSEGLGAEVKRRILMGTYALSAGYYDAFYKRAQQVRSLIQADFSSALDSFDVLLAPAAPTPAYKFGEKTSDPLSMYVGDLMTVNLNLAGLPAVCINCGFDESGGHKLPIGMQLIGPSLSEGQLLKVAHAFQMTNEDSTAMPIV